MTLLVSGLLVQLLVAPASAGIEGVLKICDDGRHLQCLARALNILRVGRETPEQRARLYARLGNARVALGRLESGRAALAKYVRLAPCGSLPPGAVRRARVEFAQIRKRALARDREPPVISHMIPSPQRLRERRLIEAEVTDNLGVREVTLRFRERLGGSYTAVKMARVSGSTYRWRVPQGLFRSTPYLHYYIAARDCAGSGRATRGRPTAPLEVELKAPPVRARSILGWSLTGLGVGSAVAGTVAFVAAANDLDRFKKTLDLQEAEEIRKQILSNSILGWVAVGVGGALTSAGIYLIATASRRPSTAVSLVPTPGGGLLGVVRARF